MRYIDADRVMEEINRIGGHNLCEWETIGVKALIDRQPTADVEEVKHGEWTQISYTTLYKCSVCTDMIDMPYQNKLFDYCPNCGARMDGVI